jgi:hypothetical protein
MRETYQFLCKWCPLLTVTDIVLHQNDHISSKYYHLIWLYIWKQIATPDIYKYIRNKCDYKHTTIVVSIISPFNLQVKQLIYSPKKKYVLTYIIAELPTIVIKTELPKYIILEWTMWLNGMIKDVKTQMLQYYGIMSSGSENTMENILFANNIPYDDFGIIQLQMFNNGRKIIRAIALSDAMNWTVDQVLVACYPKNDKASI